MFEADILCGLVDLTRASPVSTDDTGANTDTDAEVVDACGHKGLVPTERALLQAVIEATGRRPVVVGSLDASLDLVVTEERKIPGSVVPEPQVLSFVADVVDVELRMEEPAEVGMPVKCEKSVDVASVQFILPCSTMSYRVAIRIASRNVATSIRTISSLRLRPEREVPSERRLSSPGGGLSHDRLWRTFGGCGA